MVIQHNMSALNAKGKLDVNIAGLKKSAEKLSSGLRINGADDDAAGLAVSEKMRSQIRGMKQAIRNSRDGINLVQTFEGALGQTVAIIHRLGELAVQSANGSYDTAVDRAAIQMEFKKLSGEIDQIADIDFNGLCMLNGRRMSDGFSYITDNGTTWITPSEMSFPENSIVSTFQKVEGFPEITMSIDMLPEVKDILMKDLDLINAFNNLNFISVRSSYNNGVPEFSLIPENETDMSPYSVRTENGVGIISITTPKSGTVDVAQVTCSELPHYASCTGTGEWRVYSSGTGTYTKPDPTTPGNEAFDLSKYEETYVDSDAATREERQKYIDWINAANATATLVNDTTFDKDTNPLQFVWSIDGQTYENALTANGTPETTNDYLLPVYPDTSKGPQIFLDNAHFYYDDEKFKPTETVTFQLGSSTSSYYVTGNYNGKAVTAGCPSMTSSFYLNTWLDHGNESVTFTYHRAENMWSDSINGSTVLNSASYYGIYNEYYSPKYYSSYYTSRNLNNFFDADGKLPDGFTLHGTVSTPYHRTISSGEYVFNQNVKNDDFEMGETDPANPSAGGVDYKVAKHGAVYTYDGIASVWRNEDGDEVNLATEGVYLPSPLDSTYTLPLYDGMTIKVNNPTMSGDDYIQAKILTCDPDYTSNAYKRIYDNITYTEDLILQVGSRTKDSVDFTFAYNTSGIGNLENDLNCSTRGLGLRELSLETQESANEAIDALGHALSKVSMVRSSFGAIQNRLEHKINGLTSTNENLTESESGIRDADMAQEITNYAKNNILKEAAQAMIAQANQQPQSVLQLLGGN